MDISLAQAAALLRQKERIWILSHRNPDGDTTGSAFALQYGLQQLGKKARVLCSDPLPQKFSFFMQEAAEFEPDAIVSVDIADKTLLGASLESLYERLDLCLDHHKINRMEDVPRYVDMHASATCEIVFELLQELQVEVDERTANALYTGICTDTGCFQFSNTTPKTHRIAACLMECGAHAEEINRNMFGTKTKSRILVERRVLDEMEFAYEDRVALTVISQQLVEETGIAAEDLDGVAAIPRQIEGVEVGITFREREDGSYKVSVRTVAEVDAAALCATFGGGGHARAAGCAFAEDLKTAKQKLLDAVGQKLSETEH